MFEEADSRTPPVELIRGLAVLAEPPAREHARITRALDLPAPPTPSEYSDLFLFQLYPYASVHLGPEGMMGGEARSRVAGFWRALGYDPPGEPDHLSALLALYAALAEAESGANGSAEATPPGATGGREAPGPGAEARLVRESRLALAHEHLTPWVFAFLTRVRELTDGVYGAWSALLEEVLRSELPPTSGRPDLPLHLRAAPPLPDPREDGAEAFVSGLLAPVRSGFIVTRADLARIASSCDLGLRAGERRYALEHLLAQEPVGVLRALADEARRQGALHRERISWSGETAGFHARRAASTADLLEVLVREERVEVGGAIGDREIMAP